MIHELKHIIQQALLQQDLGHKSVLATVVHLEGSSYRKPGVRMLITENGQMTGAVSGGCVEKEILRRAASVFDSGKPKVMTYDGRYRLGCEGILYILIEPFFITEELSSAFHEYLTQRKPFHIASYYERKDEAMGTFGSVLQLGQKTYAFDTQYASKAMADEQVFHQSFSPLFRLVIIGGEHDAVKLCTMASLLGWEVDVISSIRDPKTLKDFPGAKKVTAENPELFTPRGIDEQTAVVIMTHNYAQDLAYLLKLVSSEPCYLGILGSTKRRDRLQLEVFEHDSLTDEFLEQIHSPAGLNLGAETPEEIALSILSEILSVTRQKEPYSLKNIRGKIHL